MVVREMAEIIDDTLNVVYPLLAWCRPCRVGWMNNDDTCWLCGGPGTGIRP